MLDWNEDGNSIIEDYIANMGRPTSIKQKQNHTYFLPFFSDYFSMFLVSNDGSPFFNECWASVN